MSKINNYQNSIQNIILQYSQRSNFNPLNNLNMGNIFQGNNYGMNGFNPQTINSYNKCEAIFGIGSKVIGLIASAFIPTGADKTSDSENVKETTENEEQKQLKTEESKKELIKILQENSFNIDQNSDKFKDILEKYTTIKKVQTGISEKDLNTRIMNYVKGLEFHNKEFGFALDID